MRHTGEQLLRRSATGGGHLRHDELMPRIAQSERAYKRFGRARFANRHGMQPDNRLVRLESVTTESFGHMQPIAGLAPATPPQP